MPSAWLMWDRIRALTRANRIYQSERIFQDQSQLDRITAGGEFLDWNTQAAVLDQTNLHINRLQRYRDYEQMDQMGEISLALDLYCLAGDTRTPLLDGTCPTIAELAESGRREFWLYGHDFVTGMPKPVLGRCPHVSGVDTALVRVEWCGGHIDCTPTHKFLTRRGWVAAIDLLPGDSLVPVNLVRSRTPPAGADHRVAQSVRRGYEAIQIGGEWCCTHKWVYEYFNGQLPTGYVIHHRDIRRFNNQPTNLEAMSWGDHRKLHEAIGRLPEDAEVKRRQSVSRAIKEKCVAERILRSAAAMVAAGLDPKCWEQNRSMLGRPRRDVPTIAKVIECFGSVEALASAVGYNHTVLSVTPLAGQASKVYDLYVDDGHAFAAGTDSSWVIVHNSDEASLVDPERKHTLIIRAKSRRIKKELEELFFGTLMWDSQCRSCVRYLCKFGDCPYEVVPTRNRDGVASLRHMNVYNFTRIETKYGDLVGFFFQDEVLPEPIFMHPWQVMHLRLTSLENIFNPYGRCCRRGTRVDTTRGPVAIEDIKVGDTVYAWDGAKVVLRPVTGWKASGKKRIWRIGTRHHTLDCSANHPILIDGKGYVRADEVKCGDRVIVPAIPHQNEQIRLTLPPARPNTITPQLPPHVDETFARLFGFLIGDGWTTPTTVEFALGEHADVNQRYLDIVAGYGLHCSIRRNNSGTPIAAVCNNVLLATMMRSLGLIGKAHEKRVPEWVHRASTAIKKAFVDGYTDADGCVYMERGKYEQYHLRSCNRQLLHDCKFVLTSLGFKCGNISGPFKNNQTVGDKVVKSRETYQLQSYRTSTSTGCLTDRAAIAAAVTINTSYAGTLRSLGYKPHGSMFQLLKDRCVEYGIDTSHFKGIAWNKGGRDTAALNAPTVERSNLAYVTENVLSVKDTGEDDETFDIEVDGLHNFVAESIVVHNSILDGGRKAFKQLRLMEDAALIYRITRAPDKRKFKIPIGVIPPKEVPEYMEMIARKMKRQRFYNPQTGTFDERYSPLIQEDDFFMPVRPDGVGPDVDVLQGAQNLDDIKDIEYFKKKMVAPMKIPFSRVGIGAGAGEPAEKSLSAMSADFAKAVQWIQREVATGLTKIALIHLALRGYSVQDLKSFELTLTASSAIEDLYRMETWQTRTQVMADLKELGWFPKEWIVTHFTDLTPDEIQELKEMERIAADGGDNGGKENEGGGGGAVGGLRGLGSGGAAGGLGGDSLGGDSLGGDNQGDDSQSGDDSQGGDDDTKEPEEAGGLGSETGGGLGERFDVARERRLLLELRRRGDRQAIMEMLQRWARRLGKDGPRDDYQPANHWDYLVEHKELDGLSKDVPGDDWEGRQEGLPYNPNNDRGLLVEWSVPEEVRASVIRETRLILTGGDGSIGDPGDADAVTEADLPG